MAMIGATKKEKVVVKSTNSLNPPFGVGAKTKKYMIPNETALNSSMERLYDLLRSNSLSVINSIILFKLRA